MVKSQQFPNVCRLPTDLCCYQLAAVITHSAILNFAICLISKCDRATTSSHANECKGSWVLQAEINAAILWGAGTTKRNVLRVWCSFK